MTGHATIIELELPAILAFCLVIGIVATIGLVVVVIIDAWKRKTAIK